MYFSKNAGSGYRLEVNRVESSSFPVNQRLVSQCLVSASSLSVLGSYSTIYPATALAATVNGLARYIWPGPLRPGKFRFCALITTCSGRVVTPGPALIHAPQLGSMT